MGIFVDAGLGRIRRAFPDIELIAPQHGSVIPKHLVDEMFTRLAELECGIFLLAQQDLDVARLLRVSSALRRITDALVMAHDFPELAATTERVLPDLLPVAGIELYVETPDEGWLCFSGTDHWSGTAALGLPPRRDPDLQLAVPGEGTRAIAVVRLTEPADITDELVEMFNRIGPALRVALERHLETRAAGREQERLDQRSRHDVLTGLYNRRQLEDLDPSARQFGVLMIDIDHFKWVNDEFGHEAGDEVLKRVATAITDNLRPQDLAVRHGGEEFLVLLDEAGDALARRVAERIRGAISRIDAEHLAPNGRITASIGVALHRGRASLAPAVAAADSALYEAKNAGRDQIKLAS